MWAGWEKKIIEQGSLDFAEALALLDLQDEDLLFLLALANKITQKKYGKKIDLCSIINAKSGRCSENCAFCAQSVYHSTSVESYSLLDKATVLEKAKYMEKKGAHRFSLVVSGKGIDKGKDLEQICDILVTLKKETKLSLCASLGLLSFSTACYLQEAGLERYHHNLETAQSHFAKICTTHSYEERKMSIKAAQQAGLSVCSGIILGLGESKEQRLEIAYELKKMQVDSVPINLLNPLLGTPLEKQPALSVKDILKTVAVLRLILPEVSLRFCGGREHNLRDWQSLGMLAGINGLMIGNYLTTTGRNIEQDLKMLKDLDFLII